MNVLAAFLAKEIIDLNGTNLVKNGLNKKIK